MTSTTSATSAPLDFIAIGLGPFNLGLACLMAPLTEHRALFLEQRAVFDWHAGMLLDDTTLQSPFLADLVTLADPTSRFSYLNYCKQQGRLFAWFIREKFYLSRHDYNQYCRWAAAGLRSVRFGHRVDAIHFDADRAVYRVEGVAGVEGVRGAPSRPFSFECRRLVIGIGTEPAFPACCRDTDAWVHSANYLDNKPSLQARRSVTVVGSGQSAAEVYRDLLRESDRHAYALHWITRSSRFFAMDTNRLALELLSPDYIDHFFALPDPMKSALAREHRSIYNGINASVIDDIHALLTARRQAGLFEGHLLSNAELRGCTVDPRRGTHELTFLHTETGQRFRHRTEGVVLATGYAPRVPDFIAPIRERIRWDGQGRYVQARNYAVDLDENAIFVQNAGFQQHGFTSPDLSLACHRNALLIESLTGIAYYAVDRGTALQNFSPPADSPWFDLEPGTPADR